ncbi:uncharacterized protein LOC122835231 [Gambusia affinis]|uniref:uncharacterized protein LOC122835231 n=1 Tax=Gambusia affinis TaxID=33528 RepID=UPI001CDD60CD|nr:uncharacterized protein LOC122835231 [Gambusia affinis]
MKVCLTLICLLFLTALKNGDAAETHARMEGENIIVECKFNFSENPIFFCKENCEGENILIETSEDIAQKGRYQTIYESYYTSPVLYVSILELKPSDSGRYRCGLGKDRSLDHEFHLDVTEATTSSSSSSSSTTIQQTTTLSEPIATTSSSSSSSSTTIQPTTTLSEPIGETNVLLYVGLSLPVLIVLLATALLIYCQRKRFHQQKGLQLYVILTLIAKIVLLSTPLVIFCWNSRAMNSKGLQLYVFLSLVVKIVLLSTPLVIFHWKWRNVLINKDCADETEYDDVCQINPEREEIKEDRQNNSSAEEISSIYC